MTGVGEQEEIVTIFFTDDEIALENIETIGFSLNNSIGASLVTPFIIDVSILDDDGMSNGSNLIIIIILLSGCDFSLGI